MRKWATDSYWDSKECQSKFINSFDELIDREENCFDSDEDENLQKFLRTKFGYCLENCNIW